MPKFNLAEADENVGGDFEALPKGNYNAEITEVDDERETSDEAKSFPNAPMTSITFGILDEPYENRNVWLNLIFPTEGDEAKVNKQNQRSVGLVKKLLRATGLYDEDELNSPEFEFDWQDIVSAKVQLKLKPQKSGDGNNIVDMMPVDDIDEDDLP